MGTTISQRLSRPPLRDGLPLLVLAALAAWEYAPFLAEGLPLRFDAHAHLARVWFAARGLAAGVLPTWANDWYGGFRLFEFYSPGYYLLGGALGQLLSDVVLASKWTLFAGQLAAVLGSYLFMRRLFMSHHAAEPAAALFGAILVMSGAQMRMALGVLGNHPSVILYALLPLTLWHFVRCSEDLAASTGSLRRRAAVSLAAGQGLLLAAMAAAHSSNTLLLLPGLLAFEVLWLWQTPGSATARRTVALVSGASLAASLLVMAALISPLVVPAMADLELVSLSLDLKSPFGGLDLAPALTLAGLRDHAFEHVFVRAHAPLWMLAGCGAGLLSLLPVSHPSAAWRRSARALFGGLLACFATVALVDLRAAIGAAFFLFPLCAAGLEPLTASMARRRVPWAKAWLPAAAIGLALLWPENRETPLPDYAPLDTFARYSQIPQTPLHGRTFDVTPSSISLDGFYGESSFSPYFSERSIPFGGYPQASPLATNLAMTLAGLLTEELARPEPGASLSKEALDLLHLLHVEFLVDRRPEDVLARISPRPGVTSYASPGVLRLEQASPALFSPRLELPPGYELDWHATSPRLMGLLEAEWAAAPLGAHRFRSLDALYRTARRPGDRRNLLRLLAAMKIDRKRGSSERIFVDRLPDAGEIPRAESAQFEVLTHREHWRAVEIVARSTSPGFVRLAYSDDPELQVELDGRAVEKVPDALTGAVVVAWPAGAHTLSLAPPPRPLARALLVPAAIVAAASLFALIAGSRFLKASSAGPRGRGGGPAAPPAPRA